MLEARQLAVLVLAIAALALTAAGLLLLGHSHRTAHQPIRQPSAPPASSASTRVAAPTPAVAAPVEPGDAELRADVAALAPARRAAREFFGRYVRFLCGRLPANQVLAASPGLTAVLGQDGVHPTPTQRTAYLRVSRLTLTPAGPPVSVTATATITSRIGAPVRFMATLERVGRRWQVVAVTS